MSSVLPVESKRPFTGGELLLLTITLALANLMEVLDISIANVSIPTIAGDLGVSANQGTWVITSYTVANAITVPNYRLAVDAFRPGARIRHRHRPVHRGFACLRPVAQSRRPDRVQADSGRGRRIHGAAVAGPADE